MPRELKCLLLAVSAAALSCRGESRPAANETRAEPDLWADNGSLNWMSGSKSRRRMRGVVLAGDRRIPGAVVEMHLELNEIVHAEPVTIRTEADGTFDLGEQPATDALLIARAA